MHFAKQIERVAINTRAPFLLEGPTGAGKSFLARRIFELKVQRQRLTGQFVEVNCAAWGAISASAKSRTLRRNSSCSRVEPSSSFMALAFSVMPAASARIFSRMPVASARYSFSLAESEY